MDCAECGAKQCEADEIRRTADPVAKAERNRAYYERKSVCPCGCGEKPCVLIGTRLYCKMTAALLGAA
jgi:hypothetical protein